MQRSQQVLNICYVHSSDLADLKFWHQRRAALVAHKFLALLWVIGQSCHFSADTNFMTDSPFRGQKMRRSAKAAQSCSPARLRLATGMCMARTGATRRSPTTPARKS